MLIPALLLAFLLGSLPWSLWVGRARGVDLRRHGSGNLGATNVYRVLGWRLGLGVLLLDILKGTAAVLLARLLAPGALEGGGPALAGLAAVAGHMFTPFASFRGGKGVATGLGIFIGLAPAAALFAFGVWAAVVLYTGWISLGSGMGALALPVFILLTREDLAGRFGWTFGLAAAVALLVVVRHRSNWSRIREGREQAIWERRPEAPEGAAPAAGKEQAP